MPLITEDIQMPAKMMTIEENKKEERERERLGLDGDLKRKNKWGRRWRKRGDSPFKNWPPC
jgi:hypothetical protein